MRSIIDLGTNTFHLMIVDENEQVVYKTSLAVKLGMGGINKGIITEDALQRALGVLQDFRDTMNEFQVPSHRVFAFGTSALRNASNAAEVIEAIKQKTDIEVTVISGEREAGLIYEGVKQAVEIDVPSLIVDIGGGSVEFIICNKEGILWKQSVEIGGQRLMELFFKEDPISPTSVERLNDHFRVHLVKLANACHQYAPEVMVGSSGSYDTLNMMYFYETTGAPTPSELVGNEYPLEAFIRAYEQLLTSNRDERMAIPGMIELRVDMIVVAVCLIRYLIQTFGIGKIKVSKYAMKEGIMAISRNHAS